MTSKFMECCENSSEKFTASNVHISKKERSKFKKVSLLETRENMQFKSKSSRKHNKNQRRNQLNLDQENNRKINETRIWSFEKINSIYKCLMLTKEKGENTDSNTRKERGTITTDFVFIKMIIKKYY